MNFLFVSANLSYPEHKDGTAVVLFNIINELQKNENKIELFYFGETDKTSTNYFSERNITVHHQNVISSAKSFFETGKHQIHVKPRNCWQYQFSKLKIINADYDIILLVGFESLFVFNYIKANVKSKIVFFQIDSTSLYYHRSFLRENNIIKKYYYCLQNKLVRYFEKKIYQKVDKIIFVSEHDKTFSIHNYKNIVPTKFENIRNGVEIYSLSSRPKTSNQINLGFSGLFQYQPNYEAGLFILQKIAPKLIEIDKRFFFHLIGKTPPEIFFKLASKYPNNIVVTGYVDNVQEYLSNIDIFLSPLFIGSGMKNKILQAMGLGIPIIANSVSMDGIHQMKSGVNCIVCDSTDEEDWVKEIIDLSSNTTKMIMFSEKTKNIIKLDYQWSSIVEDLLKKCN